MYEKTLVFIDAGFLSKLSMHLGHGEYLSFKVKDFVRNLCFKNNLKPEKIFYYTAPPFQSHNPDRKDAQRKERYDKFKNALIKEGIIFREGRCQRLKIDEDFIYKQKGVDTLLAIDLSHIKDDFPEIKKIILVSSDTDFVPIIRDIKKRGIEVILYTYFDRKRKSKFSLSNELIACCSEFVELSKEDFEVPKINKKHIENES